MKPASAPPTGGHRQRQILVAVLTYRRPADLEQALPQVAAQGASVTDGHTCVSVVVVDNDPQAGARGYVQAYATDHPGVPVLYEHEAEPGIAAARNRALAAAEQADMLVFIDDDERPSAQWLASLLATYDQHRSAAVVGPVISEFADEPDPWITAGRFFVRLRRPTGSLVKIAATNNLLLDLHQIRGLGLRFDPSFGISGGSDTLFTRELHRRGGRLVWCDEAVVTDVVPPARVTRSWVMRRALRSGNAESTTLLSLTPSPPRRAVLRARGTARGLLRIAGGSARILLGGARRSPSHTARGARTCARGVGMLLGAWGYSYQEYKRKAEVSTVSRPLSEPPSR